MKAILDPLTNPTGWAVSSGSVTVEQAAGLPYMVNPANPGLQKLTFSSAGVTSLSIPMVSLEGIDNFSISIKADTPDPPSTPNLVSSFRALIRFIDSVGGVSIEYFLPLPALNLPVPVSFENSSLQIDRIEIEALSPVQFFITDLIAYRDDFPLDLYSSVRERIQFFIDLESPFQIGTLTATPGDSEVSIAGLNYADRGTAIRFGNEVHLIDSEVAGDLVRFADLFDGSQVIEGPYLDEPVYLHIPILINPRDRELVAPSFALLKGFLAQEVGEESHSVLNDSVSTSPGAETVRSRYLGETRQWSIFIEGQSRFQKIDQILIKILTRACSRDSIIYIHGRRHDLITETGPENLADLMPDGGLSRIQVATTVDVTSERIKWDGERQPIKLTPVLEVQSQI